MSRVEKSIWIDCDPAAAIDYIAEVENHPAFIGPLKSVRSLDGDPRRPGTRWEWTFVMAGIEFTGSAETVAYEPESRFTYRTTAGIESTFTYRAEPADGGSRVSVDVEYRVPDTLLAKTQAAVVERLNDAEGSRAVENLKAILE